MEGTSQNYPLPVAAEVRDLLDLKLNLKDAVTLRFKREREGEKIKYFQIIILGKENVLSVIG
jgi:hypothetical protein